MDAGNPQFQEVSNRLQIVMETYQKDFLAAIKRSNEEMQRAIAEASSSVAKEVQQATTNAAGESKSESGPPMNLTELTGQLFEQAQANLNQLRTESAAALAEAIKPFGSAPQESAKLEAIDPRAAAAQILNQATQTLDVAVQALIASMQLAKQTSSANGGPSTESSA